jgi:hypothetical protein
MDIVKWKDNDGKEVPGLFAVVQQTTTGIKVLFKGSRSDCENFIAKVKAELIRLQTRKKEQSDGLEPGF